MKSKLLIPIMTIVLVMILIPTSAAEDITNETLENGETENVLKTSEDDVLGKEIHVNESDTIEYLVKQMRDAGKGDVIYLHGGTFTGDYTNAMNNNNDNLKIYGGSSPDDSTRAVIDLTNYTATNTFFMQFQGENILVKGIHFKNYNVSRCDYFFTTSTNGGDGKNFTIEDCIFENITTKPAGVVLRFFVKDDYSVLSNCHFYNNTASLIVNVQAPNTNGNYSGRYRFLAKNNVFVDNRGTMAANDKTRSVGLCFKINGDAKGDGICNSTFINNRFIRNSNAVHGTAYCILGHDTTIIGTHIENNSAVYATGIEAHYGHVYVYNSTFINNVATGGHAREPLRNGSAGAIGLVGPNNHVENCRFINNYAERYAGAIDIIGSNTTVINSRFYDNCAYSDYAGAVHIQGNHTIVDDSYFENNYAPSSGAVQLEGNHIRILNSNFTENGAIRGGACYIEGYNATIMDSQFTDNTAARLSNFEDIGSLITSGGGIYVKGEHSTVIRLIFTNNSAVGTNMTEGFGGALYIEGKDINFHDEVFTRNYANCGGAVYIEGSNIYTDMMNFTNNEAIKGGAIFIKGNNITLNKTTSIENYAVQGGAIFIEGNESFIENSLFEKNRANRIDPNGLGNSGGSIHIAGDKTIIENVRFMENTAEKGGAVSIEGNDVGIEKSNFTKNTASRGGAVFVSGNNSRLYTSIFANNSALKAADKGGFGGAVYLENSDMSEIDTCEFKDNTAEVNGGAINWNQGADGGKIINSIFRHNTANENGGALYWCGDVGSISESNFMDNHAKLGGAVYWCGDGAVISSSDFTKNSADTDGGAMLLSGINNTVRDSSFVQNNAENGGAVNLVNSTESVKFTDSKFEDNRAASCGGAVNIESGKGVVFERSQFLNNIAQWGGAIYSCIPDGNISNSEFISNGAVYGGAVYLNGAGSTVESSDFTLNTAIHGGAIYVESENNLISMSRFNNNNATYTLKVGYQGAEKTKGGAVYIAGDKNRVVESHFLNNTAVTNRPYDINGNDPAASDDGFGGGIFISANDVDITSSMFNDNVACNGSAVYVDGSNVHFVEALFFKNQAWSYVLKANPVEKVVFKNNNVIINVSTYIGGDNIINGIYNAGPVGDVKFTRVLFIIDNDENRIEYTENDVTPVQGAVNSVVNPSLQSAGDPILAAVTTSLYQDSLERYQEIVIEVTNVKTGKVVANKTVNSDYLGNYSLVLGGLDVGNYTVKAYHKEDRNYRAILATSAFEVKENITSTNTTNTTGQSNTTQVVNSTSNTTNPVPENSTSQNSTDDPPGEDEEDDSDGESDGESDESSDKAIGTPLKMKAKMERHATGNPLILLLMAILAIVPLRRRKS